MSCYTGGGGGGGGGGFATEAAGGGRAAADQLKMGHHQEIYFGQEMHPQLESGFTSMFLAMPTLHSCI